MSRSIPVALSVLALTLTLSPTPASACGGFFCDNSQPVNQAAERIVFARTPDGGVTAVIQIQYSGPSESFAWMLPVVGAPEIAVSSNTAFQRLQSATNPLYQLTTRVEGSCRVDDDSLSAAGGRGADSGFAAADGGAPPPVTVVDRGAVGPYDFVIISVDPTASDVAAEAVAWLRDNGYDVNEFGSDRLTPYLESGMNLLAFRLTKGNSAGSIRPVMLSFGNGLPSIPIRPTAVAATDDMGIMVWVLGEHRAVPANYASLELNEALINWFSPSSNYNDVVTRAANEAGGQGFVTEMAGAATPLADTILAPSELSAWETIRATDWTGRHRELLESVFFSYGPYDGMLDALLATVPPPLGVSTEDFRACPGCYVSSYEDTIEGFDPAVFLARVDTDAIEPMRRTRALFVDIPYVTRLYTTMSADEMTMDPIFDFNADLGDLSNLHTAERVIECSPSISRSEAPWRVALEGGEVRGQGRTWPFSVGDFPANLRISRVGDTGTGTVIEDNEAAIAAVIAEHNASVPSAPTGSGSPSGSGCSATGSPGAPGLALGLFGVIVIGFGRRRFARR